MMKDVDKSVLSRQGYSSYNTKNVYVSSQNTIKKQ